MKIEIKLREYLSLKNLRESENPLFHCVNVPNSLSECVNPFLPDFAQVSQFFKSSRTFAEDFPIFQKDRISRKNCANA